MQPPSASVLECRALAKSFAGVPVLRGIDFVNAPGNILGIAGENGAGKSTLMNIVGGIVAPDAGSMYAAGEPYRPQTPIDAAARGIAFVHQELNLFPNLPILDNLFLTGFPCRRVLGVRLIDRPAARARAAALLEEVGLRIHPETKVERLSLGERQLVEIARALRSDARLIMLDEPTTSLARPDAERLFGIMRELTARGIALIYVSHALEDLLRLCDDILVLRDGEAVARGPAREFTKEGLVTAMVGRSIEQIFPPKPPRQNGPVVLEGAGLSQPGVIHDVSFRLHAGEVLGISGLMGSGRSETARILFGLDPVAEGEIRLKGERIDGLSTRERIRRGLAFVTESRHEDGLFVEHAVETNLKIVAPAAGPVDRLIARLQIRCADPRRQPVKQLSGGNQQKVALGKWLVRRPSVLILDEPTRGIDVGAKHEIYHTILELAGEGVGVLIISSEIEELIGICDRILVMRKGELRGDLACASFDREEILKAAL